MLKQNKQAFLRRYVTMDKHESITTRFNQKSLQLSGQQLVKTIQSDQKLKRQLQGYGLRILGCLDYLEKGEIINSEYYMALLDQLKGKIKVKRPQMQKKRCCFTKTLLRATRPRK
ncbi:hypothetical protein TNCV_2843421 [Trichonephila clavipes]|nr:hypothetical protein TNCV_2843421 [Trichonephila clavipes]